MSDNDLKPEKPNGDQTFLKSLSCVDIDFGKDCQEMMNVQSQLLFIGSSAKTLEIMVAERKGFADWSNEASTPEGVPLRSTVEGARGLNTKSMKLLMLV